MTWIVPSPITYVNAGLPMKVADLLSSYPASVSNLGQYARVSDLYGSVDDIMRSRWDGINYRWVPQRESFNVVSTVTSGTVNITPLFMAPTVRFTSTLTGNVNAVLVTDNAYLGLRNRLIANGALGVFSMNVSGLVGSSTVPLIQGGVKDFEYGASGWFLAA